MKLVKTVSMLLSSAAMALCFAACGTSTLGGGDGGGDPPDIDCTMPNPAGCKTTGCPSGQVCVDQGCSATSCICSAETGTWACTEDCGGGTCVPENSSDCTTPNPAGCKQTGCPTGQVCVEEGCKSSSCACDPTTGMWGCDDDCGGGICKPAPSCLDPNPAGCKQTGCPAGEVCAQQGCKSSGCACGPDGLWVCDADCGGGECVPEGMATCSGPNPAGCKQNGCPSGQKCAEQGCEPSACACDPTLNAWVCTDDCGGGECVPDA